VLQVWEAEPLQVAPPHEGAGLVHVLVCVPPPHDAEQDDQAPHPPLTGLLVFEQEDESVPGLLQTSVVQELLSLQSEFELQATVPQLCVLHDCEDAPEQSAPPLAGVGLVHVLV